MNKKNKISVIIPSAGFGKRMKNKVPKQFLHLNRIPILVHTIKKFETCKFVDEIIIVTQKKIISKVEKLISKYCLKKVSHIVIGGKERQDSVKNALYFLKKNPPDVVLIHDAVRPFTSQNLLKKIFKEIENNNGVVPVISFKDTIAKIDSKGKIETHNRDEFKIVQTPQAFKFKILLKAFENAYQNNFIGTDESSLVLKFGYKIKIMEGEETNFKITTQNDFMIAKKVFSQL